jgi:hypothetical protein
VCQEVSNSVSTNVFWTATIPDLCVLGSKRIATGTGLHGWLAGGVRDAQRGQYKALGEAWDDSVHDVKRCSVTHHKKTPTG